MSTSCFKFNKNGNFNFSTKLFGGMSCWGIWKPLDEKTISLTYQKSSTDEIPPSVNIEFNNCESFNIGKTIYFKSKSKF
jgi:hypothetical protein